MRRVVDDEDDNEEDTVDDDDDNQVIYWNTTAEAILPTQSSVILGKRLEQQLISVTNLHTGLYSCSTRWLTSAIYLFVKGINNRICTTNIAVLFVPLRASIL